MQSGHNDSEYISILTLSSVLMKNSKTKNAINFILIILYLNKELYI